MVTPVPVPSTRDGTGFRLKEVAGFQPAEAHLEDKKLVYQLVSLIPKGKVITYGQISKFLRINSPRLVGQILHKNPAPKNIPCHRVVFSDGRLSKNYAFGGERAQMEKLKKEGIAFLKARALYDRTTHVNLKKHQFRLSKALKLYFQLLKKFGEPGPWPWFQSGVRRDGQGPKRTKEEIVIGAILTQNTNWRNVEKALNNLRDQGINTLAETYQLGKKDLKQLRQLIRPSGFYNQKGERLWRLAQFIIKDYKSLNNFLKLPIKKARSLLLSLKGVGEETADTILLYALDKPIFVIDAYTRRFVEKYKLIKVVGYNQLQKYFIDNLPENVKLFQDYHALIVRWGKERKY